MVAAQSFNQSTDQYYPTFLTGHKGISTFLKLHHIVIASLPEAGKHFVKRRFYNDLTTHFKNGHHLIGIYDGNKKIVAQALITYPDIPGTKNLDGYPFGPELPADQCVVVQSIGIHPSWRGKGLRNEVLKVAAQIAEGAGRPHIIAKMSADNEQSIHAFSRSGYACLAPAQNAQFMLKSPRLPVCRAA